jgi:DNA repair exonuclease SbcCD nuclease subunit
MKLIGDTHFGKKFKTGVPLNRRGDIEELFYDKFQRELQSDAELVVQLGDLFDSPIVDLNTIMRVYLIIKTIAEKNPMKRFIYIRGNHDSSRDKAQASAFNILENMLIGVVNVRFVTDVYRMENKVFIGWDYFREDTLREVFNKVELKDDDVIFGHFEEPLNEALIDIPNTVYSGHIHKKHSVGNVHFVGSLLPLAFGEESDSYMMETVTLDELLNKNPEEIQHKRIRVILKEGEQLPDNVDCLQLIAKKSESNTVILDNEIEEVNMKKLFEEELSESGLFEEIYGRYNDKLHSNI